MNRPILCLLFYFFCIGILHAQTIPEKMQKGISLFNEGKVDDASRVFQEILSENPNHGPAHFMLGQIAFDQNQWTEAQSHLKTAVHSDLRRPHLAWQLLGKIDLIHHRYAEARQSFDRSLQNSPDFVPALIGRATCALFLNDTNAALADLQNPAVLQTPEGSLFLAELQLFLNRTGEAEQILTSASSDTGNCLLNAITANSESRNKILNFISENPGISEGYLALALLPDSLKSPDLFQIAFQLNDQNPVPFLFLKSQYPSAEMRTSQIPQPEVMRNLMRATAALKAGEADAAKEAMQLILNDRPGHVLAQLMLGDAFEKEQDLWSALSGYKKLSLQIPGVPAVESRIAALEFKMEAYGPAECHARKTLTVQSENGSFHYLLATILEAGEQIDPAIRETERAIDLGFQEAIAYVTLGNLYYKKMEISKSISALGKAIEKDPRAAENIASFALSALTTEDYSALRKLLKEHVTANPENVGTIYSLALMSLNENHLDDAKKYLLQLEKLAPGYSQVFYNLGLLYFRLGQDDDARAAMARFEDLKQKERGEWLRHNRAHQVRLSAQEAMRRKDMNECIRLYSQLAAENLAEFQDLMDLARACIMDRRSGEALTWFQKALEISPYHAEALKGAATAAKQSGKNDLAQSYSSRAEIIADSCK